MPVNVLKKLFCTFIFSYLNYGLMRWGTACQTKLRKIEVSQNNGLRCIFFANKRENPASYFTLLGILKLESIFKLKIAGPLHKTQFQKQKKTPPALYGLVQLASKAHNYGTRYGTNQNLHRPPSRSNYGLARFRVVASQIWEELPIEVKCLPFNTIKKEYKRLLQDSQF